MDKQRNSYNGRFGETASGSRRPTGSYRSQPSGGYKSRPDYEGYSRPGSRTAPGDSYTRRPAPHPQPNRAPSAQSRERKKRRRAKRLRVAAVLLLLILIVAGVIFAICAKRNQVVHQMPTVVRTAEFENVTITEET